MNAKHFLMVAVAAAFTTCAFAESSVTLYGTIDGALSVNKEKGGDAKVQLEDGVAGGSVWGLQGEEDLGNGYSVGFTLENGYKMNNGSADAGMAWSKQATLSVSGGFGELAFGRMGSLASYEGSYSIWDASVFGTDYKQAGLGNVFAGTGTINNNAVVYVTPDLGGFKFHAMYSNGTAEDSNKWSANNHYYGLGATYEIGDLNLAAIVERYDMKGANADADVHDKASMIYSLSAAYDFKAAKVFFGYQYAGGIHAVDQLEDWTFQGKGISQNAFSLSVEVPAGAGTFKAGANYGFGKVKGVIVNADEEAADLGKKKFDRLSLGAAYEYPLSKRSFVYAWGGWQKGGKALKDASVRGSFENWSLGVGLHHNF